MGKRGLVGWEGTQCGKERRKVAEGGGVGNARATGV